MLDAKQLTQWVPPSSYSNVSLQLALEYERGRLMFRSVGPKAAPRSAASHLSRSDISFEYNLQLRRSS